MQPPEAPQPCWRCLHLAVHMTIISPVYPNTFWAFCLPPKWSVCANRSNGIYYYVVAFFQGSLLPLLLIKSSCVLILMALSFFPSHLSVGFCALQVSISTLHSPSPEDSSCPQSPFTGEGCQNNLHRTSRRAGGKPDRTPAFNPVQGLWYLVRLLLGHDSSWTVGPCSCPESTRCGTGPEQRGTLETCFC